MLEIGKQYKLKPGSDGGLSWFIPGSEVVLQSECANGNYVATGKAGSDFNWLEKKIGDYVEGYVKADSLVIEEKLPDPADYSVFVEEGLTRITVKRRLTEAEVTKVLKAIAA